MKKKSTTICFSSIFLPSQAERISSCKNFDAIALLIGRVGFAAGFKYPDNIGNVYVRASVLHDFCGDVDYNFTSASGGLRKLSEDLGGTWVEYGVGANFNFTDQMHGYVDLERQSGGEIQEDWRWNLGVRYSF